MKGIFHAFCISKCYSRDTSNQSEMTAHTSKWEWENTMAQGREDIWRDY